MAQGTIIYIGGVELPDKNAAAHRVLSNAKIFRDLGYSVVFIDVDKTLEFTSDIRNTKKDVQGFECWSIPYPKSKIQWLVYLTSIKWFKIICSKYDNLCMVICYNYQAMSLIKMIYFCKKNYIKLIADCTEWYGPKRNGFSFFIIKSIDTFFRMRILHKRLDGIIVISKYLEKYYQKCNNVIYLPPLVDLAEDKWKQPEKHVENDVTTFVYAGSPGDKDKISILIDLLSQINAPYILNIIGITKQQYLLLNARHSTLIDCLGGRIHFLGRMSHIDTLTQVKLANFSIFFREKNRVTQAGFPTKFVESLCCGTPVITTRTGDLENYLIEGLNGFFLDINDQKQAVEKLETIFKLTKEQKNKMKKHDLRSAIFDYKFHVSNIKLRLGSYLRGR